MSALARVGGLFVERTGPRVVEAAPAPATPPTVAVLCGEAHGRAAAAAVGLALARRLERPCGIATMVGVADAGSAIAFPSAVRAARGLRMRGMQACGAGRLVWLHDRRAASVAADPRDAAALAAAASAEVGRAALVAALPAAIAIPLARVDGLDRVLAWHDGIVVAPDPELEPSAVELALASLALLGRPVARMRLPSRVEAHAALCGLQAPACALEAVDAILRPSDARPGR